MGSSLSRQDLRAYWPAIAPASAPDSQIMGYASVHDFVIFTYDLDFGPLTRSPKSGQPDGSDPSRGCSAGACRRDRSEALRASRAHLGHALGLADDTSAVYTPRMRYRGHARTQTP